MLFQNDRFNLFGTDGIRGRANEYPLTVNFAVSFGKALATILLSGPREDGSLLTVLIGKDTRNSCSMFESAISAALCSSGIQVKTLGIVPTPAVAYLTKLLKADAGIMVSASHNPYYDNGIKVFGKDGYKLSQETEEKISLLIQSGKSENLSASPDQIGTISPHSEAAKNYVSFIREKLGERFQLNETCLVVDCAHGASYSIAPSIFRELGGTVIETATHPNGFNINDHCGAVHPDYAAKLTLYKNAHLGISLDGDGDRCILIDERGDLIDGDQILGICAIDMKQRGLLNKNTVVTTVMSNIGLDLSLRQYGISTLKTPVGDRHVVDCLSTNQLSLGGEQSGHIIFMSHGTTGDGIVAALNVLEIMKRTQTPLSQLKKAITLYPQVKINVPVTRKEPFSNYEQITDAILNAETALKNKGRVFVRYSGTEPLARIMLEGEDVNHIEALSQQIATSLQQNLS